MRARRRDREHVNGTPDARGDTNRSGSNGGGGGGNRNNAKRGRRRNRNRNRGNKGGPANAAAGFWGDKDRLPAPTQDVRITDDPAAVARSLGAPPLPGHEKIAEHYFTVVYERAVQTAGALAAAGGLVDPNALAEELSD